VSGLSLKVVSFESHRCVDAPLCICRRRSREGREQCQPVSLEARSLLEVQGVLPFNSPLPALTEDKMLGLDGWSTLCLA